MYKLVVEMKDVGTFETFSEAFREFFKKIKEITSSGMGTSWQVLETMCWIERHYDETYNIVRYLYFYEARDLAYRIGLMKEMKIQENVGVDERVANSLIDRAFEESPEIINQ